VLGLVASRRTCNDDTDMRLFVSGTDTAVGKTVVTCLLLRALQSRSIPALGMKPIAAGINPQGRWDDVEQIRAASTIAAAIEDIAPYRLSAAASPHFAAREEQTTIQQEIILAALSRLEQRAEMVVIEGVGGFRVPLSDQWDSADLAQVLAAPILLVVPMRLGCINHALLTAEAIASRGLTLVGWVANAGIDADYGRVAATIDTLNQQIGASCVGILPARVLEQNSADCLNIGALLARLRAESTPHRRCS
jgi:dethiobiotin synthetase